MRDAITAIWYRDRPYQMSSESVAEFLRRKIPPRCVPHLCHRTVHKALMCTDGDESNAIIAIHGLDHMISGTCSHSVDGIAKMIMFVQTRRHHVKGGPDTFARALQYISTDANHAQAYEDAWQDLDEEFVHTFMDLLDFTFERNLHHNRILRIAICRIVLRRNTTDIASLLTELLGVSTSADLGDDPTRVVVSALKSWFDRKADLCAQTLLESESTPPKRSKKSRRKQRHRSAATPDGLVDMMRCAEIDDQDDAPVADVPRAIEDEPSQTPEESPDDTARETTASDALEHVLQCPITLERMTDPVVWGDGYTYERRAIEEWAAKSNHSPMTGAPVHDTSLRPNHALRSILA